MSAGHENVVKHRGRRPKGAKNKISPEAKAEFLKAFQLIGGARGLFKWAGMKRRYKNPDGSWRIEQPNLGLFYDLLSKLIPTETNVRGDFFVGHYIATPRPTHNPVSPQEEQQ